MAGIIWPVDAVNGAPEYSGRMLRETTVTPFVAGATSSRPLGARSGVRPGTPSSTVTATTDTWTVQPFAGIADLETSAAAGAYSFAINDVVTGAMTAQGSNPRIDIIYVQVSDPAESDSTSAPGVAVGYLAGTAAASPSAPSTPARSLLIATISVPASGGGDPAVSWVAPIAVAAGGIVPVSSVTELNALAAFPGAYADLTATTSASTKPTGLYRYTGSAWVPVYGDTGWITPTLNAGTMGSPALQYRRIGGVVFFTGLATPTADDQKLFTLPSGFLPLNQTIIWCERGGSTYAAAKIDVRANGAVYYRTSGGSGAVNFTSVNFIADA